MSELWCEYEARINWLQMYQKTTYVEENEEDSGSEADCNSPAMKRRRSGTSPYREPRRRSASCEQCSCEIQYYEGDQNRTYSSSPKSFIPTGAEVWPSGITEPRRDEDNCVDDEDLSKEAMSFLNAQNDYFGPGGEYIADRIEQDFDLRWDYKRARQLCIAHLDPSKINLKDLHFACGRGRRLISFWAKFESLEKPSQQAWDLGNQAGHVNFPEFYLYWRPDFAGPHVQLQTGSLTGGNIPNGVVWPRRWWKEALRRRNALIDLQKYHGKDCLQEVDDLISNVQNYLTKILSVRNMEAMDEVVKVKTERHLKPVLERIRMFSNDQNDNLTIIDQLVNFDNNYHQPKEIDKLSRLDYSAGDESFTKQLTKSYFCLHEYLCSTIGAARLRFRAREFIHLKKDLENNLKASQQYYQLS